MEKTTNIPLEYIVSKIYEFSKNVKLKSGQQIYNFSCPVCNEGKSKNKRRGFFMVDKNYFYCQNCQKSWSPISWIMEVSNASFREVMIDAGEHDNTFSEILNRQSKPAPKPKQPSLPYDSINLNDPIQLKYYDNDKTVQECLRYIKNRRLNTSINKPKTFYISLTDMVHKNRLCIPFFDENGKIVYYQTRALYKKDEDIAKYLSKKDADKTLYGINNIISSLEYIFLFEGPIDSMFCQNGVGVCGLTLTSTQQAQLDKYRMFKRIWVLDNQLDNIDVLDKYNELISKGENIFFWPKEFKDYKDINAVCVSMNRDSISPKFILNNTLNGMAAKMKLTEIINNK